ncbi:MAG: hypothetical protein RLZZ578_1698 [Bacteroidota bacterium]
MASFGSSILLRSKTLRLWRFLINCLKISTFEYYYHNNYSIVRIFIHVIFASLSSFNSLHKNRDGHFWPSYHWFSCRASPWQSSHVCRSGENKRVCAWSKESWSTSLAGEDCNDYGIWTSCLVFYRIGL